MIPVAVPPTFPVAIERIETNSASEFSEEISKQLRAIQRHQQRPYTTRSWRRILLDLSRIAKECANAGWDGYNAKPISNDAVLTTALAIGFNLIPRTVEPPLIIPEPTGNIGLEWENKDGSIFVLSFSKTNQITYAGIFSDGRKIHGTEPFSTEIPQTILQALLADFAKQSN